MIVVKKHLSIDNRITRIDSATFLILLDHSDAFNASRLYGESTEIYRQSTNADREIDQ